MMDDKRFWALEESLWTGGAEIFARLIDDASLTVVPAMPFLFEGREVIPNIADAPRWQKVAIAHGKIARPEEGLIVAAYKAVAQRKGADDYNAWCTSTWRRAAHDDWRLVQHQQMHAADTPLRGG